MTSKSPKESDAVISNHVYQMFSRAAMNLQFNEQQRGYFAQIAAKAAIKVPKEKLHYGQTIN